LGEMAGQTGMGFGYQSIDLPTGLLLTCTALRIDLRPFPRPAVSLRRGDCGK
jgi:hypothetical protein